MAAAVVGAAAKQVYSLAKERADVVRKEELGARAPPPRLPHAATGTRGHTDTQTYTRCPACCTALGAGSYALPVWTRLAVEAVHRMAQLPAPGRGK